LAPSRWRRFVVRPIFWLLAALALAVLGLRLFLGSDLARTRGRELLAARLGESLGRSVTIGEIDFTVLPPTLEVHDLTIAGERPGAPAFLRLASAHLEADLGALRQRAIVLQRLELRGLDLGLEFREDGSDNLPRPRGGGGGKFDVRIDGLEIADSVVRLDHRQVPLALRASGVAANLVGAGAGTLDGSLSAQEVELELPDARPITVSLSAGVRLEGDRLRLRRARVLAPDLSVAASGEIGLSTPTDLHLDATVESSAGLLDRLGWLHGEIGGDLAFAGSVDWQGPDWTVAGRLRSPRATVVGFALDALAGDVSVDATGARLGLESARWADGDLRGSFAVDFAPRYPARLEIALAGGRLDAVLAQFEVPAHGVRGLVNGPFRYDFDLLDAARGSGQGDFAVGLESIGAQEVPATGRVGVTLAEGVVRLDPLRWRAAGQSVEGSGSFDLVASRGRFDLQVASEDLGRLAAKLPFLPAGELWVPTAGTGELDLALSLDPGGFSARVDLAAAAVEAPGARAEHATGTLVASDDGVTIERLELDDAGARLILSGNVPSAPAAELDLTVVSEGWPLAAAAPWLPVEVPASGPLRGTLHVRGTTDALRGDVTAVVSPAELYGIDARRWAFELAFDPAQLEVRSSRLDFEAGGVEIAGTLRLSDDTLDLHASAPALALDRPPLATIGSGTLAGSLHLEATLGGTLDEPDLKLEARSPEVRLGDVALGDDGDLELAATWRRGQLAGQLEIPGVLSVKGGGVFAVGSDAALRFDVRSPRLDRLVELAAGRALPDLSGEVAGELAVDWPSAGPPRGRLQIPALSFRWRERELRSLEPVVARLDDSGLTVDSFYLGSADDEDEVFLGGRVGGERDPELDLHLSAQLGLGWLEPWLGDLSASGRVDVLAGLRGTLAHPEISGQASWSGGRVVTPYLPHSLDHGEALALFYPNAIVLDRLEGDFASGRLTSSGRLQIRDGSFGSYRFEAAGRNLSLRWPAGWQLRGNADLTLQSTAAGRQIAGQLVLDRAYYFQDVDLSPRQLIQRLLARSPVLVPETDELLSSTALDIALRAPQTLRVSNNVASLSGTAELAIRGSLARPAVFGDVTTAAGSKVTYSGTTYQLERGVVTFANPTRIDPILDVVATTRVNQYDVRLLLSGPLSRPVAAFSSDPPLPDLEILGLLTTGAPLEAPVLTDVRPTSESGGGTVAAEALLYGQAANIVGARVGKLFGFDRIRVEPLTTGDSVSTARVTVGKRLSSKLFVTYSFDPSSTAQDIIQVEWQVSDGVQLVLTQNGDESYSVDARWETRF